MRFLSIVFLFCLLTTSVQAKVFNAQTATLNNGLQIVVVTNKRAPVVTHMVWYKVGAADEQPNLSGMAHYFEHLMFKGTEKLAPGEFSKTVKKLGGNDNAFTSYDYTAYFQNIAVQHLEKVMEMEADRMVNLTITPDHFASEKQVVTEERRQRTENDPKALFGEQLNSALFVNHPYATPVIGWMNEIENHKWEEVKKFYDTWYAPNNAIVVISGDVTLNEILPIATRIYGVLKPKEMPPRIRPLVPPAAAATAMALRHERIQQPSFQSIRLGPNTRDYKEDVLALEILEEIISGGPTTRLYKNLVVDEKKAINVGLSFNSRRDYGVVTLYGTPTEDYTPRDLRKFIQEEINNIIRDGVTDLEVSQAKQRLQDSAIFARDSLSGPAMTIGAALTTGSTLDDIENWPDDIEAITPKQIQDAASKYLNNQTPWIRPSIDGYLYPLKEAAIDSTITNENGEK